jgi:hypothetical protein
MILAFTYHELQQYEYTKNSGVAEEAAADSLR